MTDCIFCKIANGEMASSTLYEDDDFRVVLDLGPSTKGHCLVLPKSHSRNITDMPDELIGGAFALAKKMGTVMMDALGADGFQIVQNNEAAAGQTVFHFHIHVIPRYENDHAGAIWTPGTLTDKLRDEIMQKVSKAIS